MSLLNDALRRSAEAQKRNASDSRPAAPLQPAEYARRPNSFLRALALLALVALLGVSGWAFSQWWSRSRPTGETAASDSRQNISPTESFPQSPASAEEAGPRPAIKVSTNLVVRAGSVAASTSAVALTASVGSASLEARPGQVKTAETNPVVAGTNAVPGMRELKLQSIVYRLNKPAVVINGEMLHVGDVIEGARILKIERYTVTLVWRGETHILGLPRL